MKRCLLLFGLLLAGCSSMPGTLLPQSSPTSEILPTLSEIPSLTENTLTPLPFPSETNTPGVTPLFTATYTTTETPTETPIPWTYIFPLQPPTVADFSEGTASHGYPATDIFAPEGTKFVAVTDGVVDFVSTKDRWNPEDDDPALRGGLSVAIIGDDGVRYYGSHLSAVATGISLGVRVTVGQILGYVGHTGDARTTPPHLHFGISHPTYPEDWHARRGEVDPFPFLVAWRDGYNVTPPLPTP
jgi:murein DD-endopeptidase MepM/ murein hydrolase activator NlpD